MKKVYLFLCFSAKAWRSHNYANVISEGTHPEGEGACRSYNLQKKEKKRPN